MGLTTLGRRIIRNDIGYQVVDKRVDIIQRLALGRKRENRGKERSWRRGS